MKTFITFFCIFVTLFSTVHSESFEQQVGVQQSPIFMFVYGTDLMLSGKYLNPGDTLFAYSDDGTLCGARILDAADNEISFRNKLRFMPIYYKDITEDPACGPSVGERIHFSVNSTPVVSTPDVYWIGLGCTTQLWYFMADEIVCKPLKGDVNGDGSINVADVSHMISWWNGHSMLKCMDNADLNSDGKINIIDFTQMMNILF